MDIDDYIPAKAPIPEHHLAVLNELEEVYGDVVFEAYRGEVEPWHEVDHNPVGDPDSALQFAVWDDDYDEGDERRWSDMQIVHRFFIEEGYISLCIIDATDGEQSTVAEAEVGSPDYESTVEEWSYPASQTQDNVYDQWVREHKKDPLVRYSVGHPVEADFVARVREENGVFTLLYATRDGRRVESGDPEYVDVLMYMQYNPEADNGELDFDTETIRVFRTSEDTTLVSEEGPVRIYDHAFNTSVPVSDEEYQSQLMDAVNRSIERYEQRGH